MLDGEVPLHCDVLCVAYVDFEWTRACRAGIGKSAILPINAEVPSLLKWATFIRVRRGWCTGASFHFNTRLESSHSLTEVMEFVSYGNFPPDILLIRLSLQLLASQKYKMRFGKIVVQPHAVFYWRWVRGNISWQATSTRVQSQYIWSMANHLWLLIYRTRKELEIRAPWQLLRLWTGSVLMGRFMLFSVTTE